MPKSQRRHWQRACSLQAARKEHIGNIPGGSPLAACEKPTGSVPRAHTGTVPGARWQRAKTPQTARWERAKTPQTYVWCGANDVARMAHMYATIEFVGLGNSSRYIDTKGPSRKIETPETEPGKLMIN